MKLPFFLLTLMSSLWLVKLELKKTNIVFLKTHKCASSAIQNIFLRFGYFHDLLFVLPAKFNYLGQYRPFKRSMVPKLDGLEYNILAHHSRFNYTEMRSLMPKDAVFVTILRDPVRQFESLYGYYNLKSYYGVGINDMVHFLPKVRSLNVSKVRDVNVSKVRDVNVEPSKRAHGKFGFNQMLFDLGFDARNKDVDDVDEYIHQLDKQFDLVMIADFMTESLVFLKSLLNWDYDDLAVFKVNARKKTHELTQEAEEMIRTLNWADMRLYLFFLDKFHQKVRDFGIGKMIREKNHLLNVLQDWKDRCLNEEPQEEDKQTCKLMTEKELVFTDMLRQRQSDLVL